MSFPTIEGVATTNKTSGSTSHPITMPASIAAGELLVIIFRNGYDTNDGQTSSTPSGWTELGRIDASGGGNDRSNQYVFAKMAAGSDTCTISTFNSRQSTAVTYRISGTFDTTTLANNIKYAATTGANPPSNTPSWGSDSYLWIAGLSFTRTDGSVTAAPSLYGSLQVVENGSSSSDVNAGMATAILEEANTVQDPGTFSVSGTQNYTGALTLAVRPALPPPPSVETDAVSAIDFTTATLNGEVTDDGGATVTARGFVYDTSTAPTLSDSVSTTTGTVGVYSTNITGLTANTTYYVRAYATNSSGTSYGNEVSFTTLNVSQYVLALAIGASDGETYAVRVTVGGTTGSVELALGSTGDSVTINAGDGVTEFFGVYGGSGGLTITRTSDFDGTIDDLYYSKTISTLINWSDDTISVAVAVASTVTFKRIEDDEFNSFLFYRYLDLLFKNLNGYVTVTIRSEREDSLTEKVASFSVGATGGSDPSPFQKRRISMLVKNQAIIISLSNTVINETFSIAEFILTGSQKPKKMFSSSKIISVQ